MKRPIGKFGLSGIMLAWASGAFLANAAWAEHVRRPAPPF